MLKLGYLGPAGTFSHTAAMVYARQHGAKLLCCASLEDIFNQVQNQKLARGIVPAENSTGGSVGVTHDLLLNTHGVYIIDELLLPVKQHLLAKPGVSLEAIERVYSHPQALAQCHDFLQTHLPGVPGIETVSTADAAAKVAASALPLASIGSDAAAKAYGLTILQTDIQSNQNNVTRFFILGTQEQAAAKPCKTSLAVAVNDQPGALYHVLREFAWRGINLTRIESRPAGSKLGDYVFFIDLEGSRQDQPVVAALDELLLHVTWLKVLGSYPAFSESLVPDIQLTVNWESLAGLRQGIDLVDTEIMQLLALRRHLVDKVAFFKANTKAVVDSDREEQIIKRVRAKARGENLDEELIEQIYRLIFQGSVGRQRQLLERL